MPRMHTAAKPSAVSRALARDRLGVLFFVLAGIAPLTVAAGVIPTAYATTGLTGIPAAFLLVAVITVLGLARVDITRRVLGVLLSAEILVILAETVSGLARPAGGRRSLAVLSPATLTSGGSGTVGVLAIMAVLGFVGFEQAPVLAEEARHPRRTIPVVTYLALDAIAVVYAGTAWVMAAHAGRSRVVAVAAAQGPGLLSGLGSAWLGQAAQWLFLTSLFAAALAFHNCVWRYIFALGREGVLPAVFGRTGANSIPKAAPLAQSLTGAGRDRGLRGGRVTHRFHPLFGQDFEFVAHRRRCYQPASRRPSGGAGGMIQLGMAASLPTSVVLPLTEVTPRPQHAIGEFIGLTRRSGRHRRPRYSGPRAAAASVAAASSLGAANAWWG